MNVIDSLLARGLDIHMGYELGFAGFLGGVGRTIASLFHFHFTLGGNLRSLYEQILHLLHSRLLPFKARYSKGFCNFKPFEASVGTRNYFPVSRL